METTIPLYGFGGGGGSTGAVLTVTAPTGAAVTVTKDGKSKTKTAVNGTAVFKGLVSGTWTITITRDGDTASKTVEIAADYQTDITFFAATISVTYPAGSACTATDGTSTLVAPDTSGIWECIVPNAGTWVLHCTNGDKSKAQSVAITADGQTESVTLSYELVFIPAKGAFDNKETTGVVRNVLENSDGTYKITGIDTFVCMVPVDVTEYKTMTISAAHIAKGCIHRIGLFSGLTDSDIIVGFAGILNLTETIDSSYDISQCTGTKYFGVSATKKSSGTQLVEWTINRVVFS